MTLLEAPSGAPRNFRPRIIDHFTRWNRRFIDFGKRSVQAMTCLIIVLVNYGFQASQYNNPQKDHILDNSPRCRCRSPCPIVKPYTTLQALQNTPHKPCLNTKSPKLPQTVSPWLVKQRRQELTATAPPPPPPPRPPRVKQLPLVFVLRAQGLGLRDLRITRGV